MRHALAHPVHGYYMKDAAQFGRAGDFTTSPEVSQLFGEMVALWVLSTWAAQGRPAAVSILECGPGRGTLIADVLRTVRRFPAFAAALGRGHVRLVETSRALRRVQAQALRVEGIVEVVPPLAALNFAAAEGGADGQGALSSTPRASPENPQQHEVGTIGARGHIPNVRVSWHDRLTDIADAAPAGAAGTEGAAEFIIAHVRALKPAYWAFVRR